ncbi:MAG TPA: hypothetical protein VMR50_01465 [Myxococcota bacterium]|nr:hypothetical protein [Myxococcota bacterium]
MTPLPGARVDASATLTPDGRIWVWKGSSLLSWAPGDASWSTGSAECFDPVASVRFQEVIQWSSKPKLDHAYPEDTSHECWRGGWPTLSLGLSDAAGHPLAMDSVSARAYLPGARRWQATPHARHNLKLNAYDGSMPRYLRQGAARAQGPDGRVWVVGGRVIRQGARRQRIVSTALYENDRPKASLDSTPGWRSSGSVEVLAPETGEWSEIAPMRIARESPAAAFGADGRLYVFGGKYSAVSYNTRSHKPSELLAAEERAWEDAAGLGRDPWLSSVECYDPTTGEWSFRAPMPSARQNPRAVLAADGRLWVFGCEIAWGPWYGQEPCIQIYDPSRDTWHDGPQLLKPRYGLAVVAAPDGRIFAIGGSTKRTEWVWRRMRLESRGSDETDVEVIQVAPRTPVPPSAVARRPGLVLPASAALDRAALFRLELWVSPRDPEAVEPLAAALKSEDWLSRRSALRALARMLGTAKPAVPRIEELYSDPVRLLRWQALDSVSATGGDLLGALPMLLSALRSDDFDDRLRATLALGKLGARAIPALERELADASHLYPQECVEALREIGRPAVPALVRVIESERDLQVTVGALYALARIGEPSPAGVKAVSERLAGENAPIVDWLALCALSRLGPDGLEVVVRSLADPRRDIATTAAWVLADAAPESPRTRAALESALGGLPSQAATFRRQVLTAALAKLR